MMPSRTSTLVAVSTLVFALFASSAARAEEPWLLTGEGVLALPVGSPQADRFGVGGAIAAGVYRPLSPGLLAGARLRAGLLSDGDPPAELGYADPGMGGLGSLSVALRLRPLAFAGEDPRRGVGPFVELAGGGVLTGDLLRPGLEAGIGWGFALGPVDLAPTVRFLQILQPDDQLDGRDARVLMAGLEVVLLDVRPAPPPPPPPSDRDGDGLLDEVDGCPDQPEDFDQFEDADGCPDPDNDQDGILDEPDQCPNEPEDPDGWQDEDGCPDPDNDGDGILDGDDECPNEPETVNGNDDHDGCPDEGLIEFINDRIVLDSRVFFDTDRARIRGRARPVLEALVNLWRQHPEWTSVVIEGHADYRGTDEYNQRLSERRAAVVRDALVERGMPEAMITSIGYGSTRTLNRGDSEASLQVNRRVEFVVTSRREVPIGDEPSAPDAEGGAP